MKIAQSYWDFTQCPDDHLGHCAAYEYARHVPWIIDLYNECERTDTFRPLLEGKLVFLPEKLRRIGVFELPVGFPKKPFLEADTKRLGKPLGLLFTRAAVAFYIPEKAVAGMYQFAKWDRTELATFLVDWNLSKKALLQKFQIWIEERHPGGEPDHRGNDPKKTFAYLLNCLAAYRLLKSGEGSLSPDDAMATVRKANRSLFGSNEKKWYSGARTGRAIIDEWNGLARLS